ncbi:MAG: helix-hairpin-helix domain-containing protein, partial [Sedimentisphaerales bacterium]
SDSMWVLIQDVNSSKGKPIYAAVRIIDNGGMLNVNTGFKFDPSASVGASQMDINLIALADRDHTHRPPYQAIDTRQDRLSSCRFGSEPWNISLYEQNVVWQYGNPVGTYTPFDISDELDLRYRYILTGYNNPVKTRIEDPWTWTYKNAPEVPRYIPYNNINDPNDWFWITNNNNPGSCPDPCTYDYRHISATYNCDRVITPTGDKMVNINTAPEADILAAIKAGLNDANINDSALAAQITANLMDYTDGPDPNNPRYDPNNDVTVVRDDANNPHFGFEQPCIYISELVARFLRIDDSTIAQSYAIELYNPYGDSMEPNDKWQVVIDGNTTIPITWQCNCHFQVIWNNVEVNGTPLLSLSVSGVNTFPDPNIVFGSSLISLQRYVKDYNFISVDSISITGINLPALDDYNKVTYGLQRDITTPHKCIRRLWGNIEGTNYLPTLGTFNDFNDPNMAIIQAHPANKPFTNVGEFGQLFYRSTYDYGGAGPFPGILEKDMRIDLTLPQYQQIFKYLTVMDPCDHGTMAANESRIKGRININTAPWFVIAQLPWVSANTSNYDLARSIVDYRNSNGPFKSIGELMRVNTDANDLRNIGYWENKTGLVPSVLMTPADGVGDAYEQRDVIFDRISNLVTVRSDVFTAYILVRIGQNGPQKRVIAILDRSEVPAKPVKVIAIQSVPDPR